METEGERESERKRDSARRSRDDQKEWLSWWGRSTKVIAMLDLDRFHDATPPCSTPLSRSPSASSSHSLAATVERAESPVGGREGWRVMETIVGIVRQAKGNKPYSPNRKRLPGEDGDVASSI